MTFKKRMKVRIQAKIWPGNLQGMRLLDSTNSVAEEEGEEQEGRDDRRIHGPQHGMPAEAHAVVFFAEPPEFEKSRRQLRPI